MTPEEMLAKINRPLEEKLEETRQVIDRYKNDSCVGFSGGKDSTILAIEANKINPNIPIINLDNGFEFPESYAHMDKIAKDYKLNFIKLNTHKTWLEAITQTPEIMRENREVAVSPEETRTTAVVSCCRSLRLEALKNYMRENNITFEMLGNRFDDFPLQRFAIILKTGMKDERFDFKKLFPLAYWTEAQIFEYYNTYNIPLNPIYLKGWTSVSCWNCPAISKEGLKQTHPDLYKQRVQLETNFPWFYGSKFLTWDSFQGEHPVHHYLVGETNANLPRIITIQGPRLTQKLKDFLENLTEIGQAIQEAGFVVIG